MTEIIPKRQYAVKSQIETTARTAAGNAVSGLAIQVFRLHGLLVAAGDALAKPAGQSTARWQVLAGIEDEPTPVAQIARRLALTRQSVQRVADVLVAEGLAVYEENPAHRRAKLLRLTPPGRTALETIQAAQRSWANALGATIGEAELVRANEILSRVVTALSTRPARGRVGG